MNREALRNWGARIDALSLRERAILLLTSALILGYVMFLLLIQPTWVELQERRSELSNMETQLSALQIRSQALNSGETTPEQERRDRIATLQQQLAVREAALQQQLGTVMAPRQAAQLLQNVLEQTEGLRLRHLQSHSGTSLFDAGQTPPPSGAGVARYNLTLQMEGGYAATQRFLEKVEQLPWTLFWDSLDYEVMEYPNALIELNIYTLGQL